MFKLYNFSNEMSRGEIMSNLWIAFLTGLTTGGLSCLAVQGGLLASSLAQQLEHDVAQTRSKRVAQPILLFLGAKMIAYTFLGFLLGALGSVLQLNAMTRAVLQLLIGIFMIGNALRMLNVHPIFRYFALEPPSQVTRYIRKTAKRDVSAITPLLLGALTVLIPCGVTQAMMATAMGTGNPLSGAALMAAFTLGTSPVFFAVAYSAAKLGAKLERAFMTAVAVVVLILGLVAVESGLNLMGSPISATRLLQAAQKAPATGATPVIAESTATSPTPGEAQTLTIQAFNDGYEPATQHAAANITYKLDIITDNTRSCARAFVIPTLNVEETLPVTGKITVDIPPQATGTVLRYSCSMGMYTGEIVFDQ